MFLEAAAGTRTGSETGRRSWAETARIYTAEVGGGGGGPAVRVGPGGCYLLPKLLDWNGVRCI
jgi:hypothetical protein